MFLSPGSCPRCPTWGCLGVKICLSVKLSSLKLLDEIQPNLICELSSSHEWGASAQLFWPCPLEPWGGQISLNFDYIVNFKDFYTISQINDANHMRRDFHSVAWVMPQGGGGDLGMLGVGAGDKNLSVWICDDAPSTARSSFELFSPLCSTLTATFKIL